MTKFNKKNIFIIIGIVLVFLTCLSIYYFMYSKSLNSSNVKYNNPKRVVKYYVESLLNDDYSTAYKYIYFPDNGFVNKNDFVNFIQTKDYYNDLKEMKLDKIIENSNTSYQVILKDKIGNIDKINVDLIARATNDYRVYEEDIYIKDWMFSAPKDSVVSIDGLNVEKSLIAKSSSVVDYYVLPAIAINNKTFKLVSNLGSKEINVNPSIDNDGISLNIEITDEEFKNKAYEYIQNTWNSLYYEYKNNNDLSVMKSYFSDDVSEEKIRKYCNEYFDKISKGTSSISSNYDYRIVRIIDNPNESSIVSGNDVVTVNFGYELSWKWKSSGSSSLNRNMTRYSSIRLKIVGDSFKIFAIVDEGLFGYSSYYTRDF